MKKEDVPQEEWITGYGTRACYAIDEKGKFGVTPSKGWEVEMIVNAQALAEVDQRIENARQMVLSGTASPLLYHMERNHLDIKLMADISNQSRWKIRRHLKPRHFARLDANILQNYARILRVSPEELQKVPKNKEKIYDYEKFLPSTEKP